LPRLTIPGKSLLILLKNFKGPNVRAVSKFNKEAIARSFVDPLLPELGVRELSDKRMKRLLITAGLVIIFISHLLAGDRTALARVTVYWPGEGSGRSAAWNGARLRDDHCAVDPKEIPYGSKLTFGDGECMAVDTGPDVVRRKAARSLGRTTAERNAVVVDRFFDTRQRALAWENSHPHFMMVRVQTPD
jgi:hypothetical protein